MSGTSTFGIANVGMSGMSTFSIVKNGMSTFGASGILNSGKEGGMVRRFYGMSGTVMSGTWMYPSERRGFLRRSGGRGRLLALHCQPLFLPLGGLENLLLFCNHSFVFRMGRRIAFNEGKNESTAP
jgi:hypothetical protein